MTKSFMDRIQVKVKGIGETYECGDILIREDINTGECRAYSRNTKDVFQTDVISSTEIREFIPNIEDKTDVISYRALALPGGRCRAINDQKDQFNLYRLQSVFYALSGKSLQHHEIVTKDFIKELISQYQAQKELMKYFKLEKLYFNKEACYIGKYKEGEKIKYEELFGNLLPSEFRYEDYGIESKETVVTDECLENFGERKKSALKFTPKALQEIIEQDRNKEDWR